MKKIIFHGALKQFGRIFYLDVKSAQEASIALSSQIPALKEFMLFGGYKFAVFCGTKTLDNNIDEKHFSHRTDADTIHFVPRVMGAGGNVAGVLQVIGGAIMTGVGIFTANPMLIGAGVGLAIGGVASLLMKAPQITDNSKQSFGFGGAVTTTTQGACVPVLYGVRDVGGFVISAGIQTESI